MKIEKILVMGGATPVLLKVVLFRLSGRGNSNDDATPNFDPDSNISILVVCF